MQARKPEPYKCSCRESVLRTATVSERTPLVPHSYTGTKMIDLVQLEPRAPRLPEWLRKGHTHFAAVHGLKADLRRLNLHTVCESARCPNMHECFHRGTATFMILRNLCTRGCGFCSVPKSRSEEHTSELQS